jgi:hypothetical protein
MIKNYPIALGYALTCWVFTRSDGQPYLKVKLDEYTETRNYSQGKSGIFTLGVEIFENASLASRYSS